MFCVKKTRPLENLSDKCSEVKRAISLWIVVEY